MPKGKEKNPGGKKVGKWSAEALQRRRERELGKPITPPSYHKKKELLEAITDDFVRY